MRERRRIRIRMSDSEAGGRVDGSEKGIREDKKEIVDRVAGNACGWWLSYIV